MTVPKFIPLPELMGFCLVPVDGGHLCGAPRPCELHDRACLVSPAGEEPTPNGACVDAIQVSEIGQPAASSQREAGKSRENFTLGLPAGSPEGEPRPLPDDVLRAINELVDAAFLAGEWTNDIDDRTYDEVADVVGECRTELLRAILEMPPRTAAHSTPNRDSSCSPQSSASSSASSSATPTPSIANGGSGITADARSTPVRDPEPPLELLRLRYAIELLDDACPRDVENAQRRAVERFPGPVRSARGDEDTVRLDAIFEHAKVFGRVTIEHENGWTFVTTAHPTLGSGYGTSRPDPRMAVDDALVSAMPNLCARSPHPGSPETPNA